MYSWQEQQVIAMQMAAVMRMHQAQQQQLQFGYVPPQNATTADSEESDEDDEERRTLFVANLDDRITEEVLYECFVQAGPIESVRIPKDNAGKKRSFGFITYVHSCSTPYAHELFQGLTLFRKTLTIKLEGNAQVQPHRRSLPIGVGTSSVSGSSNSRPSDVEPIRRRSYDNSSLRGSNYPAYYDTSMNDTSGSSGGGGRNPFKHNTSSDWTRGTSSGSRLNVRERVSHVSSKSHSRNEKHHHESDHGRRSGDRRSEQRHRRRR